MMQYEYTRKPSFVQINCNIRDAREDGETYIQLIWGENQITLEKAPFGWLGSGWIGNSSGADIAAKFNRNGHNMTMQEAKIIVGNRAKWEMQAIRKALSMHSWLNTPEENQRLQAVRILLSDKVKP